MIDPKQSNEFYYKNLWNTNCLVAAYIDDQGHITTKSSAFRIGTFSGDISPEQFHQAIENRIKEYQAGYEIGASIPSELGKFTTQMRKTVTDWEE